MNDFLDFARRGRNDWWRYLATLAMALALVLLVDLIVSPWLAQSGLLPKNFKALTDDPSQPVWYFGYGTVFAAALLLSLVVSALIIHHKRFTDIVGDWRSDQAMVGAGVGLFLVVLATGIDYIVQPGGFRLIAGPQTVALLLVAIPNTLLLTLFVQVLYCGYLTQGVLLASKRPLVTAVVVGALGMAGARDWPHAAGDFATMVLWVLITIRTGGIAFAWGMSLVGELFGDVVVVDFDSPLRGSPGIFAQSTPALDWFDVAVSGLLFVILWLWIMRRYPVKERAADVFA